MQSDEMNVEELAARVLELQRRLEPRLSDVDPGDLFLILQSLLRPIGCGHRFFLRELPGRRYVF